MRSIIFQIAIILGSLLTALGCGAQATSGDISSSTEDRNSISKTLIRIDSALLMSDLQYLSSDQLGGRATETEGSELAQKHLLERFKKLGIQPIEGSFEQRFEVRSRRGVLTGKNIVGKIKGKSFPDEYIVLGAHYDHLGTRNGKILQWR